MKFYTLTADRYKSRNSETPIDSWTIKRAYNKKACEIARKEDYNHLTSAEKSKIVYTLTEWESVKEYAEEKLDIDDFTLWQISTLENLATKYIDEAMEEQARNGSTWKYHDRIEKYNGSIDTLNILIELN